MDLRLFLDRVREAFAAGFVTRAELESGAVVPAVSATTIVISGQQPSDPNTGCPVEVPTAPTGTTATGGYLSIRVGWSFPTYCGHAHTEVWAATTDDFSQADRVGFASGAFFSHPVASDETWYYWVYHTNLNGVRGERSDSASATSMESASYTLSELTGDGLPFTESNTLNLDYLPTNSISTTATLECCGAESDAHDFGVLDAQSVLVMVEAELIKQDTAADVTYTIRVANDTDVSLSFSLVATDATTPRERTWIRAVTTTDLDFTLTTAGADCTPTEVNNYGSARATLLVLNR